MAKCAMLAMTGKKGRGEENQGGKITEEVLHWAEGVLGVGK